MSEEIELKLTKNQLKLIVEGIKGYDFGALPPCQVKEELDLYDKIHNKIDEHLNGNEENKKIIGCTIPHAWVKYCEHCVDDSEDGCFMLDGLRIEAIYEKEDE